jgi:histidyl-tRNA synthetase
VLAAVLAFGVPKERLKADLAVARGLDYYTGTVYETVLLDHESLGSVCSGGRYDELTERFAEGSYPGVGISIGVTRLVTRLIEAEILSTENAFSRHVLVTQQDEALLLDYVALAAKMRKQGIATEVFFDIKGLGQQLRYASKKGFGYAIILGADEKVRGIVQVKHLLTGDQKEVPQAELINYLKDQT